MHTFVRSLPQVEGVNAPGDRKDTFFCSDQDIESYIATFGELAEMVEWVWTVYAPGGTLLSVQEQIETREEFDRWRRTGRYWEREIVGGRKIVAKATSKRPDPTRAVSFLEFRAWFLQLADFLEHLRELVVDGDNAATMSMNEYKRYTSLDLIELKL